MGVEIISLISSLSCTSLEIPGTTRKNTPSNMETNDILRTRLYYTPSPSNKIASDPSSAPEDDLNDLYSSSDEVENPEDEDGDGDSYSRYISITNPTRTTANSYTKHVPTVGQGRPPPVMPPHFDGPELIPNATSSLLPCRPIMLSLVLYLITKKWISS